MLSNFSVTFEKKNFKKKTFKYHATLAFFLLNIQIVAELYWKELPQNRILQILYILANYYIDIHTKRAIEHNG